MALPSNQRRNRKGFAHFFLQKFFSSKSSPSLQALQDEHSKISNLARSMSCRLCTRYFLKMRSCKTLLIIGPNTILCRLPNRAILVIPPVFESCTRVLDPIDQKTARDLYWEAVTGGRGSGDGGERTEKLLKESCEKNPFVGEPHVVLAQVYLGMERWEDAEGEAERGLRLLLEWGSAWDKRVAWEGWVAWVRVLLMKAKEKDWPKNPFGILNLGLVR